MTKERQRFLEIGENGALAAYSILTVAELFILETISGLKAFSLTCPRRDVEWAATGRDATPVLILVPDGEEFQSQEVGDSIRIQIRESVRFSDLKPVIEKRFPEDDYDPRELSLEFRVCASHCSGLLKIRYLNGKRVIG